MINLFPIAPQDQSMYYLNQIFGTVGNIFGNVSVPGGVSAPSQILGTLFQVINTSVLVLGTLMVVYVTVLGVLNTAQEGEFFGKKFNIWLPIRMVLGIVAMFPAAGGYSILQIMIMWFITQGIGAADKVWGTALSYAQVTGSPFSGTSFSNAASVALPNKMQTLFQGLVCQASAKQKAGFTYNSQGSDRKLNYCADAPGDSFCSSQDTNDMLNVIDGSQVSGGVGGVLTVYKMGPGGSCGQLAYPNASKFCPTPGSGEQTSLNCIAAGAQPAVLQTLVTTLGAIAQTLTDTDQAYISTWTPQAQQLTPAIQAFCSANNVSTAECCKSKISTEPPPHPVVCKGSNLFDSYPYWSQDVSNPPQNTVTNVYMPYALSPYVGNNNFITAAANAWMMGVVINSQTEFLAQQGTTVLTDWYKQANDSGWILAGKYFYDLAALNSQSNSVSSDLIFAVTPMDASQGSAMSGYRNNAQAAAYFYNAVNTATQSSASSLPQSYGPIDDLKDQISAEMLRGIKSSLTADDNYNPLARLASYGQYLMHIAEAMFGVMVVLVPTLVAATTIEPMVLGTGLTVNPFGEGVKAFFSLISPFLVILISALFSLGALLGIYVPFIPYIIFTMAAIGWMIGVIEAMTAAPFIALGILSPSGQHELLGKAEPSIMILLNIFLRPTLMVFGLIVAMLFAVIIVKLINTAFLATVTIIMGSGDIGLFEQVVLIAVYTLLIISALNKCFSLIHYLPEKVLSWIGGHEKAFGEGEALGEVKRGAEGAGATTIGAGKESAAAGRSADQVRLKKEQQDRDKANKGGPTASGNTNQGGRPE